MNVPEMVHPRDYDAATAPSLSATMMIEAREHHVLYGLFLALHDCDKNPDAGNKERVLEAYRKAEMFFWGTDGRVARYASGRR